MAAEQSASMASTSRITSRTFGEKVLNWYAINGRTDLPWRHDINPYRVWLSEIMLQQTQVSTVIPYFERFVAAFPDVTRLASAPLDEVLHLWTGLGYYARGRNLHKTAQIVCNEHDGHFPKDILALQGLPGIGKSTAGAICAIAFNQAAPILDGNVKRVLARYHKIDGWPGQSKVANKLWQKAEQSLPAEQCGAYTQAMMDIGATLCTRSNPQCSICPLNTGCQAHLSDVENQYPTRKPGKTLPVRMTYFLILANQHDEILLQRRPPVGLWGGLWCFPECATEENIQSACKLLSVAAKDYKIGAQRRHTFSHYHLDYTPVYIEAATPEHIAEGDCTWINAHNPGQIGLPRPVAQLLKNISAKQAQNKV